VLCLKLFSQETIYAGSPCPHFEAQHMCAGRHTKCQLTCRRRRGIWKWV